MLAKIALGCLKSVGSSWKPCFNNCYFKNIDDLSLFVAGL